MACSTVSLFLHGSGRGGPAAWPTVAKADATFLSFEPGMTISAQARYLVDEYRGCRVMIHAHSIGAVPAVLAAASGDLEVAGLVLVEPALYDIARGSASIERHVLAVTEARAQADAGNLRGFWAILRPLMFGGPLDEDTWDAERKVAERWATTNVPWGHGVREGMLAGIPTLVVTGGWNAEYEQIARILAKHGAEHQVLPGAEHRAQDTASFATALQNFERSLTI